MLADGSIPLHTCGVRVPGSTSNLGAGFDCIGLAFNRYLDAMFRPADGDLVIKRRGTLEDIPSHSDRFLDSFHAELRRRGVATVGGVIEVTSTIPIARGLGSSAAATVAGIALATAACGDTLDRDAALAEATAVEGHPDNAAPSLIGGLVSIAYTSAGTPHAVRQPLSDRVGFAFAAPAFQVSTAHAREALPEMVPHDVAARTAGRMAALLYGLAHADIDAIRIGFTDELHVPYRLPLIPGVNAAINAAIDAGAWAATISGSGSGIVAVCAPDSAEAVADAMRIAFDTASSDSDRAIGFVLNADMHGTRAFDPARGPE